MAGLVPAIPMKRHGRAPDIGVAGTSPAMTGLGCVARNATVVRRDGMKPSKTTYGTPRLATAEAPVIRLDTVDSTNAEALRRARAGEHGALWVVAATQTAGRGRRGRAWASPPGNLYASLLLVDPAPPAVAPQLAFVAGLAVHDACAALAPGLADALELKWPNDLLCRGAKIAGILIEGEGAAAVVAVIGIGVNCRRHPDAVEHSATDFAAEGAEVAAPALFEALRRTMATRLVEWDRGAGFAAIRSAWLARAAGLGQAMRARLPEREASGIFEALDEAGRLVLRLPDGRREVITAGEVFPVREEPT
jgi:BirA family transcriptional regulator, biotin operon repressor / biotin---[acetyl-CoA-carboxylase] ligase